MRYWVYGIDGISKEPREPLFIEAVSDAEARTQARALGMVVREVEPIEPKGIQSSPPAETSLHPPLADGIRHTAEPARGGGTRTGLAAGSCLGSTLGAVVGVILGGIIASAIANAGSAPPAARNHMSFPSSEELIQGFGHLVSVVIGVIVGGILGAIGGGILGVVLASRLSDSPVPGEQPPGSTGSPPI